MAYKIALISPPLRATSRKLPLSLLSLAGYLEKYVPGTEVKIIDIKARPYYKLKDYEITAIKKIIIEETKKFNPDMVGFTVLFSDVQDTLFLSEEIKKTLPRAVIVAGGVHASYRPDELLSGKIDYIVMGEGERTFKELVECHIRNKILNYNQKAKIKGLVYLKDRKIVKTGFRELIPNLDEIPTLPYEKVDLKFYLTPDLTHIYYFLLSGASLMTTRGCPSRCTFCTGKDLWKITCGNDSIRSFSAKRVVDDMELLFKKYKIDGIFIHDPSFTYDKTRVIEICHEILKRKLKLVWQCQTKAFMIDNNLVRLMKKAGCIQIAFGFESGSQEALNRMKKGITVEQIRKAAEICKKENMRIFPCFMINTPGETWEDLNKTKDIVKLMDSNKVYYNFAITMRYPGAEIYEELGKDKYQKEDYAMLTNPSDNAIRTDKRINMSKHNKDLPSELNLLNATYNPTKKRILMHLDLQYLKQILRSKRKLDYIKELGEILKFLTHKLLTGERSAN